MVLFLKRPVLTPCIHGASQVTTTLLVPLAPLQKEWYANMLSEAAGGAHLEMLSHGQARASQLAQPKLPRGRCPSWQLSAWISSAKRLTCDVMTPPSPPSGCR